MGAQDREAGPAKCRGRRAGIRVSRRFWAVISGKSPFRRHPRPVSFSELVCGSNLQIRASSFWLKPEGKFTLQSGAKSLEPARLLLSQPVCRLWCPVLLRTGFAQWISGLRTLNTCGRRWKVSHQYVGTGAERTALGVHKHPSFIIPVRPALSCLITWGHWVLLPCPAS